MKFETVESSVIDQVAIVLTSFQGEELNVYGYGDSQREAILDAIVKAQGWYQDDLYIEIDGLEDWISSWLKPD